MNANVLMIDTICNRLTHVVPPLQNVYMAGEDKRFSLIRGDMSPNDALCENTSFYNANNNNPKVNTEKDLQESDRAIRGKVEIEGLLEDQEGTRPKDSSPVFDMGEQPDLELALWAKKFGLVKPSSKAGGERKDNIQIVLSGSNSQTNSFPLVAKEVMESAIDGLSRTHEGQAIPGSNLSDTPENAHPANNHFKMRENDNGTLISIPAGMTAQTRVWGDMESIEEPVSDMPAGTIGMRATEENNLIVADTPAVLETPERPVSTAKDLVLDGVVDCGKTMTGDGKSEMMNISLVSAKNKSSGIQLYGMEADSDKRVPTDETVSQLRYSNGKESTHTGNDLSSASGFKAYSINEFQTSTDQPEGQNRSTDNNSPQTNFKQMLVQNNPPAPIAQQSFTLTENVKTAHVPGEMPTNEILVDVGKQIFESIQSSLAHRGGDQQISIRLNPPELGKVLIRFQEQNSELTGLLEVNKVETRTEIEQALPQLIQDLTDCGIQIRRLDIMLSEEDRSGYGAPGDQSPLNNEAHGHDAADSQTWDNDGPPNGSYDWSTNNKSYQPVSEMHQMLNSEGSINVLV